MAELKIIVLLAICIVAISVAHAEATAGSAELESKAYSQPNRGGYGNGNLQYYQCPGQCARRCSQTQYRKPCMMFCQNCCAACLCVPSGYYGNKGECPCYNNMKTKRGGPKCP